MNERIQRATLALRQALEQDPILQEYNRLARIIQSHPKYAMQENALKELQQAMVHCLDEHDEVGYQAKLTAYQQAKALYDEDPILQNYLTLKEEVNEMLQELSGFINQFDTDINQKISD